MKLLFLLLVTAIIASVVYFTSSLLFTGKKKKNKNKPLWITVATIVFLLGLIAVGMYKSEHAPDIQCGKTHTTTSQPPQRLTTAYDYLLQGDYEYELGDCQKAVDNYTKAIELNPNHAEAYNNRGYTYMRMRNYEAAIKDLDKAIDLRKDYINALMNRGDLYNYYGPTIDHKKAIADYNKAISLGATQRETSVCGHKMIAENGGWSPMIILKMILKGGPNATC